MLYDWKATLAFVLLTVVLSRVGRYLVFKVPALNETRRKNQEVDRVKRAQEKYPPVIKAGTRVGMYTNGFFFLAVAPFCVTLSPQPLWNILLDVAAILMLYDFLYYLTHRFVFHGQGYMRRVHALHHQARSPTHIDAYYVHPLETFIGIFVFLASLTVLAAVMGSFHAITMTLSFMVFTQLNVINHCHIDLPYFPFKTLSWISAKHAVHHQSMHSGNYATITLLYDKVFGTLR